MRARIVWTEAPALTAPVVALNRINGQFFAYVAEAGEGGKTVARQRAVEPGPIVGNDYVVKSGLKPGEKLIVSGVQKIRDGSPVTIGRRRAGRRPRPGRKGRSLVLRRLHPAPDPRHRLLARHHPGRGHLHPAAAHRALPAARPAVGQSITAFYTGANAQAVESAVTTPLEQVDQRRRGHDVHAVLEHQQRRLHDQRLLRHRPRPRPRRRRRAEPRQPDPGPPARRRAHHGRHRHQELRRLPGRPRLLLQGQPLHRAVHQQLPRPLRARRDQARARRRQRDHLRRAQVRDARSGSTPPGWPPAASRPATW